MLATDAVLMRGPRDLGIVPLALRAPRPGEVVVEVRASGVSTGTERLFWTGEMPPFPGMGYPLVPGYEAAGVVVEGTPEMRAGTHVFVPGADCYEGARGLFGGAARHLVTDAARCAPVDPGLGAEGALLALAATARHAITGPGAMPDLVVGHGTLGRLAARLVVAAGGAPTVWEVDPARRDGAAGYAVLAPEDDPRRDYGCILDASGDAALLDTFVGRLAKGGEVILAGFYKGRVAFDFVPAFLKEARLRVAAEWTPADLAATRALVEEGHLSLAGLVTHRRPAAEAPAAYAQAFEDRACLKMILDWEEAA